jgi:signal transduction histidine kinase/DNA-binding response OmpR family regulator/ligand-binding sensor domain-containing protein
VTSSDLQRPTVIGFLTFLAALIFLSSPSATAQVSFESVGTAQGLSQGMVHDILQDRKGFLWMATKDGLNKYDGHDFTVYRSSPFDTTSLSSNFVKKIQEDSYGLLWVITESNGLSIMDTQKETFLNLIKKPTEEAGHKGISKDKVRGLIEIEPGRILLYYDDSYCDEVTYTHSWQTGVKILSILHHPLPAGVFIKGMVKGEDQTLWIGGSDNAIYTLDPQDFQLKLKFKGFSFTCAAPHPSDGSIWAAGLDQELFFWRGEEIHRILQENHLVNALQFEGENHLWLAGFNGLIRLTLPSASSAYSGKGIQQEQLFNKLVYSLCIDASGLVWIGLGGEGLKKVFAKENQFSTYFPGESIRHVNLVGEDKIYFGKTWSKWLLLEKETMHFPSLVFKGLEEEIENFTCPQEDLCYIITQTEFLHYDNTKIVASFPIKEKIFWEKSLLTIDQKGWVYISSPDGWFYRYHPETLELKRFFYGDLFENLVKSIEVTALDVDKSQNIWIGTNNGFVLGKPLEGATDYQFKRFVSQLHDRNSLSSDAVSCFLQDRDSLEFTYIGTKGGGLNLFNRMDESFAYMSTEQGLPNDVIYGLLYDEDGKIWGSTNRGIFALNLKDENKEDFFNSAASASYPSAAYEIELFNKYDGLQDQEFNSHAYATLPDGRLLFGGISGVNIFQPASIQSNAFAPQVAITKVLSNNKRVLPLTAQIKDKDSLVLRKKILLSHQDKIITFEFASLDFHHPQQNKFRYKMQNIDPTWREVGTQRNATYVNLKPGKYTFSVQGTNSSGVWSHKTEQIELQILPPFWKTLPAYVLYGILVLLMLKLLMDLYTKRKNLQFEIIYGQKEAQRMKELSQFKTEFFTNITHELRTPLTVIMGLSNELKKSQDKKSALKGQRIYQSSHSLVKMVNQLLDVAKIESGKLEVTLTQGDAIQETNHRIREILPLCENKGLQIHFQPPQESLHLALDFSIFSKVLTNLLSNAIKFTPSQGSIFVFLERKNLEEGSYLQLKVQDTGPGIPLEQQKLIFEKFYQVPSKGKEVNSGSGIGLSLCRELMDLVKGDISVKSPMEAGGTGTLFTASFPLTPLAEMPEEVSVSSTSSAISQKNAPVVLIVEDNEDIIDYLKICLKEYSLAVAKNGKEGFLLAQKILPDLVISDIMMPVKDGLSLCQSIKAEESTNHIPVILLSAKTGFEQRIAGFQAGAHEYIEKPFHSEELLAIIHKILQNKKSLSQYFRKQMGLPIDAEEPTGLAASPSKSEDLFVQKVKQIIEENYADPEFTVEILSKKMYLSYRQLHRKLESISGFTPNQLITLTRLNQAKKELMAQPDQSIAFIADACGFNDPSYFSRLFKKNFGKSPAEWRKTQA